MLDSYDRKLLALLQRDASLSVAQLAEQIHLSTTPCWRRLKRLEEEGFIEKRVALVNARKVGLPVTAFVSIRTNQHDDDWLKAFRKATANIPEIVEVYDVSGEVDYLMKVVATDIEFLSRISRQLLRAVKVADISSTFVLEQIKHTTELPLERVEPPPGKPAREHRSQASPRKTHRREGYAGNRPGHQNKP